MENVAGMVEKFGCKTWRQRLPWFCGSSGTSCWAYRRASNYPAASSVSWSWRASPSTAAAYRMARTMLSAPRSAPGPPPEPDASKTPRIRLPAVDPRKRQALQRCGLRKRVRPLGEQEIAVAAVAVRQDRRFAHRNRIGRLKGDRDRQRGGLRHASPQQSENERPEHYGAEVSVTVLIRPW